MPIFEYACKKCGKEFEALVLKTTPAPSCPKCKSSELEKLISRPAIKSESTHGLAMKAANPNARTFSDRGYMVTLVFQHCPDDPKPCSFAASRSIGAHG